MPETIQGRNPRCPGCPERPDCKMTSTKKYHKDGVWYCVHCAKVLKLKPDTTYETRKKQSDAKQPDSKDTTGFTEDIIGILYPNDFSLKEEYSVLKQIDFGKSEESYTEKFAFAHWMMSNKLSREPQTLVDVGKVLDISPPTLYRWRDTTMLNDIRAEVMSMRMKSGPAWEMYSLRLLQGVRDGNAKCLDKYTEIYAKPESKENKDKGQTIPIDKDLVDVADDGVHKPLRGIEKKISEKMAIECFVKGKVDAGKPN